MVKRSRTRRGARVLERRKTKRAPCQEAEDEDAFRCATLARKGRRRGGGGGSSPVMRGFTPRIINASSCAASRSTTGGRLHRDKCKAADLLTRLISTGCSRSTRISRRHGIMAIEFINAPLKLLVRRRACGSLVSEVSRINDISC